MNDTVDNPEPQNVTYTTRTQVHRPRYSTWPLRRIHAHTSRQTRTCHQRRRGDDRRTKTITLGFRLLRNDPSLLVSPRPPVLDCAPSLRSCPRRLPFKAMVGAVEFFVYG